MTSVAAIRRAVDLRTGIAVSSEYLISVINQALMEYALHARWPWLSTSQTFTADGTADFTLDDAVTSIESVKVDGEPAHPMSQAEADVWDRYPTREGYGYAVAVSTLTIAPTPASGVSIVVKYRRSEAVVADDDDEPLLPDPYAPMLYAQVAFYVCAYVSDARASFYADQATQLLRGMEKSALRSSQRGQSIRIRPGAPF